MPNVGQAASAVSRDDRDDADRGKRMTLEEDDVVAAARSHTLGDALRRSALRHPDKLALVAGDVRWSVAEFDAAANRVATAAAARGITKGDRVAVLSHSGWEDPIRRPCPGLSAQDPPQRVAPERRRGDGPT
jgi:non-ribosomal peptide synthetase component F